MMEMMMGFFRKRTTPEDAINYALRMNAELAREIDRLGKENRRLERKVDEIGFRLLPEWPREYAFATPEKEG